MTTGADSLWSSRFGVASPASARLVEHAAEPLGRVGHDQQVDVQPRVGLVVAERPHHLADVLFGNLDLDLERPINVAEPQDRVGRLHVLVVESSRGSRGRGRSILGRDSPPACVENGGATTENQPGRFGSALLIRISSARSAAFASNWDCRLGRSPVRVILILFDLCRSPLGRTSAIVARNSLMSASESDSLRRGPSLPAGPAFARPGMSYSVRSRTAVHALGAARRSFGDRRARNWPVASILSGYGTSTKAMAIPITAATTGRDDRFGLAAEPGLDGRHRLPHPAERDAIQFDRVVKGRSRVPGDHVQPGDQRFRCFRRSRSISITRADRAGPGLSFCRSSRSGCSTSSLLLLSARKSSSATSTSGGRLSSLVPV